MAMCANPQVSCWNRTTTCFRLGDLHGSGTVPWNHPLPFSTPNRSGALGETQASKFPVYIVAIWWFQPIWKNMLQKMLDHENPNFLGVRMKNKHTWNHLWPRLSLANHLVVKWQEMQDCKTLQVVATDWQTSSCLAVGDAPGLQCRDFFGASLEAACHEGKL